MLQRTSMDVKMALSDLSSTYVKRPECALEDLH